MSIVDSLKKALGMQPTPEPPTQPPARQPDPEPDEITVPEVTVSELIAELQRDGETRPFLLDIREPYERRQAHIEDEAYIPMNSLPARLGELPRDGDIVVYCAHGNRSYAVSGWLIQQGFRARSLRGGIVEWQMRGGAIMR
jgi:rhodanese-related sulfurtransferase